MSKRLKAEEMLIPIETCSIPEGSEGGFFVIQHVTLSQLCDAMDEYRQRRREAEAEERNQRMNQGRSRE